MSLMKELAREVIAEFRRLVREDPSFVEELRAIIGAAALNTETDSVEPVPKRTAARLLRCHEATLDRAVRAGCPVVHFNGRRRFVLTDVRAWFAARKSKTANITPGDPDPINVDHVIRQLGMQRRAKEGSAK